MSLLYKECYIKKVLNIWREVCDGVGVRWYLYKETLLCAVGYRRFPELLSYPQIVCFAEDLSDIIDKVVPKLPNDWILDKSNFGRGERELLFRKGRVPVLEICVLYGAEDEEQLNIFDDQLECISTILDQIKSFDSVVRKFDVFSSILGDFIESIGCRLIDENFRKITLLLESSGKKSVLYRDSLTNKKPITLPTTYFNSRYMLCCDGVEYPVFSGFREYLIDTFGDYEVGLFDEVGCGLSKEEKKNLKIHQNKCFEALKFLQELSEEFNLRYYLVAGSVLGCIRHKGFIPWDDDIDVGIRIEDIERFESVVKKQLPLRLPNGYELMQAYAGNSYPRMFSKICFNGRCCIDLWPLVPTVDEGKRAKLLWRIAKVMTKVHYVKIGHNVNRFRRIAKFIGLFLSDNMVMKLARYNERFYKCRDDTSYVNLYSIYNRQKETIKRDWIDDECTGMFNGLEVPIVGCTDEYLTHLYGDYMTKPAPWKRALRHTERFYTT